VEQASLTVENGPDRIGEEIPLAGDAPVCVGKAPERVISLIGPLVSRHHCSLMPASDGSWQIEDRGSRNGVFVNGEKIESRELCENDLISIGDYALRFRSSSEAILDFAEPVLSAEDQALHDFALASATTAAPAAIAPGGPICPSCRQTLTRNAKICVSCGIDLRTGKPLQISHGVDENSLYCNTETAVWFVSWLFPVSLMPIPVASEAYGKFRPYALYALCALNILISVSVWIVNANDPAGELGSTKNLMLWAGDQPNPLLIEHAYAGKDPASIAFHKQVEQIILADIRNNLRQGLSGGNSISPEKTVVEAYLSLPSSQQKFGEFHPYQLLTNTFLHASIIHLVGNMIFLIVFGNRVNALLGQWKAAGLYLLLGVFASLIFYLSMIGHTLIPALGASGAIMGMAGMYFVLMPVSRVHSVIWWRRGMPTVYALIAVLISGHGYLLFLIGLPMIVRSQFRLLLKIFSSRGFWILLLYIAFDVWATIRGSQDETAHWAHVGGFACGMIAAFALLFTRQVDAHGGDILTVLFGPRAWKLLGTPAERVAA
jgi:membrane associated rhomboid family serine protease